MYVNIYTYLYIIYTIYIIYIYIYIYYIYIYILYIETIYKNGKKQLKNNLMILKSKNKKLHQHKSPISIKRYRC